jgi:TolB-like protein
MEGISMKKAGIPGFLLISIGLALFSLNSCSSTAGGKSGQPTGTNSNRAPVRTTALTQVAEPAPAAVPPPNPYYAGDGGKDMSLAVLIPDATGLEASENYLPTLVQGVLVGDLSKYSAMSVLDRQNLEKVLKETESGIYKSEAEFLQLGEIANVGYAMTGAITKTRSGFALSVAITDTKTGTTRAAYNGSCTAAELDNFTGVKKASLGLLTQLGVELTGQAKNELSTASATEYINAQTALSKGIIAQRGGNTVESLVLFYEANNYDPTFGEATMRLNTLSSTIRTGSLGDSIRNEIALRKEWLKLIDEAHTYIKANPLSTLVEMTYNPALSQVGGINYHNETIQLEFSATLSAVQSPQYQKMLRDIGQGVEATGKTDEWGLRYDPSRLVEDNTNAYLFQRLYRISADLINDKGQTIATYNDKVYIGGVALNCSDVNKQKGRLDISFGTDDFRWQTYMEGVGFDYSTHAFTPLQDRYLIGLTNDGKPPNLHDKRNSSERKIRFTVKADDITDSMTIRIKNVYEYLTVGNYRFKLNRYGPDIIPIRAW